jgi:iron complex outermembrane receptor protein
MRSDSRRDAKQAVLVMHPRATRSRIGFAVATALAGVAAPRAPAFADSAAAAAAAGGGALTEVVVTARKVQENLQDVPISINVLTQQDLQNLGIGRFDDFAYKVPSMTFNSIGPGTQVFFCRGVSDGSNGNYANTSATAVLLDDSSLSWFGVVPDLHLYDVQRIEVLNGPQGTTFGASAMACAIRYITNKPDPNAFSAGVDLDVGKIHGGRNNQTYEGYANFPIIDGRLALRVSGYSAYNGGFIDNVLTTRTWYNGTVSNNAPWAGNDFNTEHQEGGRIAVKGVFSESWSATLSFDYQRLTALGAWDQDPNYGERKVSRFGPEFLGNQAKVGEFHLDGDVGIADLVFASTYWSLPTRRQDEYSQYMQNFAPSYTPYFTNGAAGCSGSTCLAPPAGTQQGFTCVSDPAYGGTPFTGCGVPLQYYEYHTNPERWSNELRFNSKPGGRFHWVAGAYWEKTRDKNSGSTYYMPNQQVNGAAWYYENTTYSTPLGSSSLPPGVWYAYTTRSDYLATTEFANINFDVTSKLNVEGGVSHFHSDFKYYSPYGQFAYAATTPSLNEGSSHKVDARAGINYKVTDQAMLYAVFSQGFRDGGANGGLPGQVPTSTSPGSGCYQAGGAPPQYKPDSLNNYELGWKTTWLENHLVWNGATYLMNWKDLQTIIYDATICPTSSFYTNVGQARIYGVESNVDYRVNENWSLQAATNYTDSHLISTTYPTFEGNVGERLPFVAYFNWSANVRYDHPLGTSLKWYGQYDVAHKGDMWDDLHVAGSNGFPRMLQPAYTLMNLRFGLTPAVGNWLAELYCTNLADKNAIIYTNTGNFDLRYTVNEPRVIGLRLSYRFGKGAVGAD